MSEDPRRRRQATAATAAPTPPPPPPPPPEAAPDSGSTAVQAAAASPSPPAVTTNGTSNDPSKSTSPPPSGSYKLRFCTVCASNNNRSMEAHLRLSTSPAQYPVISFGTGSLVRLPGPSIDRPNVYSFGTTSYDAMYRELESRDARLYKANGILNMLGRNRGVKWGPERWQDWRVGVPRVGKRPNAASPADTEDGGDGGAEEEQGREAKEASYDADLGHDGTEAGTVDVVFTCEERCWDAVVDDLLSRGSPLNRPVHVFNVDIRDNHEEALVGGRAILELADALNAAAAAERDVWAGATETGATTAAAGFDAGKPEARAGFDARVPDILAEWQQRWPHLPALWTLAWF